MMSRGVNWFITMGANEGLRNFKLQNSEVRKKGNIGLKQSLIYINPCTPLSTSFFHICLLFISVTKRKNCSRVEKFLKRHFPLPQTTPI